MSFHRSGDPPAPRGDETLPVLRPRSGRRGWPATPAVDVAGRSEQGLVRPRNEDCFLAARIERRLDMLSACPPVEGPIEGPPSLLLLVADGMGGHGHGDLASSVVADAIAGQLLLAVPAFGQAPRETLLGCHARLQEVAARKGLTGNRIGTTLTLGLVHWPDLYVVHVGDSRGYLLRRGTLRRITTDHTLGERMREQGATPSEEFDHVLVNAIGGGLDRPEAELHHEVLEGGDALLLCSDGLTTHVDDDRIRTTLIRAPSASACCDDLIGHALDDGGSDNVTVVTARFGPSQGT